MENFESVEQILDFAIAREEEAAQGYRTLADQAEQIELRQLFMEFAQEEIVHREKLLLVKEQKLLLPAQDRFLDLRIKHYVVDVEPEHNRSFQQALLLAIRKEKSACMLYHDLAERTGDSPVRTLLLSLADEEAKHQQQFENHYDTFFLN